MALLPVKLERETEAKLARDRQNDRACFNYSLCTVAICNETEFILRRTAIYSIGRKRNLSICGVYELLR